MKETERLHGCLAKLSCESCYTRPMKNDLLFGASYLVKKEQKETFDKKRPGKGTGNSKANFSKNRINCCWKSWKNAKRRGGKMTNNRGILVYCIADRLDESIYDIFGLDGENKLFAVGEKNLYALSSYVDLCEYGEESIAQKGEDIEWLKQKAGVFMDIMLRIKATSDIVPMKFITIFTSEDRVKESIRDNLAQFISNFEKIQGCEEISVKFYCDPAVYKDYHMGEELKSFEKSLSGKPKGAGFFLRKKFESEINDKIRDKISKTANGFSEVLRKSAQDMKSNKLLAKEITGIETPMVLNCAFLVKTEQMEGFCKKCGELSAESCIKGFTIEWSGPWPPYHFCR